MSFYSGLSDNCLLDLLKNEDRAAFSEIYERYWKKLLGIAYNHTKDKLQAEEIVQEVFISIWNRKTELDIISLSSYLATAIKFSVFKYLNRESKRKQLAAENYKTSEITFDNEQIEARFLAEYINGVIERLPEKCKLVFKLSRINGMSIPEIADKLEISEKTVESHLTKGLKTVRLELKDAGILMVLCATQLLK